MSDDNKTTVSRLQAFLFSPGQYRVIYPDGPCSMLMPKCIAEDYAKIFGGRVVRD